MNLFLDNLMYIGLGVVALFVLLCLISESVRRQFKKVGTLLLILAGLGLGYYFITGKSPTNIPGDINRFFADPHIKDEPTHKYYRDPAEDERRREQLK